MKELYLYSPIYDSSAQALVEQMEEAKGVDTTLRMLTGGGSVYAGWSIIGKMNERTAKLNIKVDGAVMSMGAVMLLFADHVEALDVSTIMLHRADMYVSSPEDQKFLDDVNKAIRAKMEAKIDLTKLPKGKLVTMDQLFDPTKRIDLYLTASEAKAIGLVDKVNKLNPTELEAFNNRYFNIAATGGEPPLPKNENMTIEKLKAEFPAVYAAIIALGVADGIAQEKDRVEACLVFNDIDPAGVKAAIESGKAMTAKQMADFSLKSINAAQLKKIGTDSANPSATGEADAEKVKTEKEKALSAFEAETRKNLGLK